MLNVPSDPPPVKPLTKPVECFCYSEVPRSCGPMGCSQHSVSQLTGDHHLPPFFRRSRFLPGSLQHSIPHSQRLKHSPHAFRCSGAPSHLLPGWSLSCLNPLSHRLYVHVLLLLCLLLGRVNRLRSAAD